MKSWQLNDTLQVCGRFQMAIWFECRLYLPGNHFKNFSFYLNYNTVKDESENQSLGNINVLQPG